MVESLDSSILEVGTIVGGPLKVREVEIKSLTDIDLHGEATPEAMLWKPEAPWSFHGRSSKSRGIVHSMIS